MSLYELLGILSFYPDEEKTLLIPIPYTDKRYKYIKYIISYKQEPLLLRNLTSYIIYKKIILFYSSTFRPIILIL